MRKFAQGQDGKWGDLEFEKHTAIIPAEPGWRAVRFFWKDDLDELADLTTVTVDGVGHESEPIIAWIIVAFIDDEALPNKDQHVQPVICSGDGNLRSAIIMPDGRISLGFEEGNCLTLNEAKEHWITIERRLAELEQKGVEAAVERKSAQGGPNAQAPH